MARQATRDSKSANLDHIQTSHRDRKQTASSLPNRKGRDKPRDPPKSQEIRRLEFLHNAVRTSTGKDRDPKGGCFCQAREHTLSTLTPICRICGLILCTINQPYYACPHCSSLLLTSIVRISLEERFERLISDTLTKEADERQRTIEEVDREAGAFPALPGIGVFTSPNNMDHARSSNPTHKVLSLDAKTKKLTISYTPNSSAPSSSHTPQAVEEEFRVPPPPVEVYARGKPDPNRPWAHITGGNAYYIPVSQIDGDGGHSKGSGKTRQKHKEKTKDDGEKEIGKELEANQPSI